ncbi:MAG: hypothetical protein AB7O88_05315 [Reyranellaceae bacterium]
MARDPDLMRDVVRRLRATGSPIHPQDAMAAMEGPGDDDAVLRAALGGSAQDLQTALASRVAAARARARS